jgi:hypothetical protein
MIKLGVMPNKTSETETRFYDAFGQLGVLITIP